MQIENFFTLFGKDRLGATKLCFPALTANLRGDAQKLLDLTVDDKLAAPLIISIRSEYSTQQSTVSNTLSSAMAIVGATNAAPIAIATTVPPGFVTGQSATVTNVRGNLAANLATTITVPAPLGVVGATFATPIQITTAAPHGYPTGAQVNIQGVLGNIAANGNRSITVTGAATFTLDGSVGSGAYGGGGICTPLNVFTLDGSNGLLAGVYLGPSGQVVATSLGGTGTGIAQVGSPLVGSLLWGVGGGENQVDFDVPSPRWPEWFFPGPAQQPEFNIGSGVQIAINASHVSLYVRNDAWLGPLTNPLGGNNIGSVSPAKVIAFCGPNASGNSPPLQRTIFVAGSDAGAPADNLAVGAAIPVNPIPPFAKSVRFQRIPNGTPLLVRALNNVNVGFRQSDIPVNSEGPMILDAFTQGIIIQNVGAVPITYLQAVFDVTPL